MGPRLMEIQNLLEISDYTPPLKSARNSANMAPLGFKRAELESYGSQLFDSTRLNPHGAVLAEFKADLRGVYNLEFRLTL